MKLVVAFYGYFDYRSLNSPQHNSWTKAWSYYEQHVYQKHTEIETVFHTWEPPTEVLLATLKPIDFVVGTQIQYNDDELPSHIRTYRNHRTFNFNNLKNRLRSMRASLELAKNIGADLVFLTRFDAVIKFDLDITNVKEDEIHTGNWPSYNPLDVLDHYYLGTTDAIRQLCALEDALNGDMFANDSAYASWLRRNKRDSKNWMDTHMIFAWWIEQCRLKPRWIGKCGVDTCLARSI